MRRVWSSAHTLTLILGLSACQGGDEPSAAESADTKVVPDRPAPALTDPASPAPIGTDIGTLQRDTSAGPVANDSVAIPGR